MNPAFQLLKTLFRKHWLLIVCISFAIGTGAVFAGLLPRTTAELLGKLFIFLAVVFFSLPVSFGLAWCYDNWLPASFRKARLSFLLVAGSGGVLAFCYLMPEWLQLITLWLIVLGGLVAATILIFVRFRKTPWELLAWLIVLFVWLVICYVYFFLMEGFFFPRYC